jgi:hypothetical protein
MPTDLCFMPVSDPATVNDRLYLDPGSSAADRDQESTASLHSEPAEPTSGSPDAESSTTLAELERNEFCVHRPKEALIRRGSSPRTAD